MVKVALKFIICNAEVREDIVIVTEIEWLPSVGFLILSSLFWLLVYLFCFSADFEVGMSEF